jgi:hypothetical protein
MAKIVEAAKVNSTKKPCYRLWLTHLSILRISKDAAEIQKLEVMSSFTKLINRLKTQLEFVAIRTDRPWAPQSQDGFFYAHTSKIKQLWADGTDQLKHSNSMKPKRQTTLMIPDKKK